MLPTSGERYVLTSMFVDEEFWNICTFNSGEHNRDARFLERFPALLEQIESYQVAADYCRLTCKKGAYWHQHCFIMVFAKWRGRGRRFFIIFFFFFDTKFECDVLSSTWKRCRITAHAIAGGATTVTRRSNASRRFAGSSRSHRPSRLRDDSGVTSVDSHGEGGVLMGKYSLVQYVRVVFTR